MYNISYMYLFLLFACQNIKSRSADINSQVTKASVIFKFFSWYFWVKILIMLTQLVSMRLLCYSFSMCTLDHCCLSRLFLNNNFIFKLHAVREKNIYLFYINRYHNLIKKTQFGVVYTFTVIATTKRVLSTSQE